MNTTLTLLFMFLLNEDTDSLNRRIALEVLERCVRGIQITQEQIAEKCSCSKQAVNKFCRLLGYQSFKMFKTDLTWKLDVRINQMKAHFSTMDEQNLLSILHAAAEVEFEDAEYLNNIDKVNELIYSSSAVSLYAAGFPESLLLHYMEDMAMLGKKIIPCFIRFTPAVRKEENTLILIVSITGRIIQYFPDLTSEFGGCPGKSAVCTSFLPLLNDPVFSGRLYIPVKSDHENGNLLLLTLFQLLKYRYYINYCSSLDYVSD